MTGTLSGVGYMWCMMEKAGTAPAKKTGRLLSIRSLANATKNATANKTNTTKTATTTNKTTTTPTVDAYAALRA